MEIKSALWQRLFAVVVFGFIGFLGLAALLKGLWPQQIHIIGNHGETPAFMFSTGLCVLLGCLYCWWRIERYCLRADMKGIRQQTSFGTTSVKWQDVAFYRVERLRGTREDMMEPVLYNHAERVLLRPIAPLVAGTVRMDDERAQFWQYVQDQLAGKEKIPMG